MAYLLESWKQRSWRVWYSRWDAGTNTSFDPPQGRTCSPISNSFYLYIRSSLENNLVCSLTLKIGARQIKGVCSLSPSAAPATIETWSTISRFCDRKVDGLTATRHDQYISIRNSSVFVYVLAARCCLGSHTTQVPAFHQRESLAQEKQAHIKDSLWLQRSLLRLLRRKNKEVPPRT